MQLNREQIKAILPHREPMLLVSAVEELTASESIKASFYIDPAMDIFRGHFPSEPVLPGAYSVECMAQAADILLLSTARYHGKIPLFLGINNVRFLRKLKPGETITICASLTSERREKAIAVCAAEIFCGEERAAQGDVTLAMR